MTFAPQTLKDLAAFWASKGGTNLGIVGDQAHATKGVSYHLGRSQLIPGAYSAQTPRDKAGLTEAASAIDLGRLDGSYAGLRKFSEWLATRCVKNQPGTHDIREVIYSPDGKRVLGYKDGIDYLIPAYGDNSHLGHTHISYYRDSEKRDKRQVFADYWLPTTDTQPTEAPMKPFPVALDPHLATVKVGAQLYLPDLTPWITAESIKGAYSPYGFLTGGVHYRVLEVTSAGTKYLGLAKLSDCTLAAVAAPGDCAPLIAAAKKAALDHVAGPAQALLTAITEARA